VSFLNFFDYNFRAFAAGERTLTITITITMAATAATMIFFLFFILSPEYGYTNRAAIGLRNVTAAPAMEKIF